MRTLSILVPALLAGALATASGQTADQAAAQSQLPGVSVTGHAPPPSYYVAPELVHEVSGAYHMSNNETARISDRRSKLYVEFDQRVTELQPVADNVYTSRDEDMTLHFRPEGFGDGMALIYVPRQNLAMGSHEKVTVTAVAQR